MRKGYTYWTQAEVKLLFELKEDEAWEWWRIASELGRGIDNCKQKYQNMCARRRAERGESFQAAPSAAMIDRERREHARANASITAQFFGDPPEGWSALDRRRRA